MSESLGPLSFSFQRYPWLHVRGSVHELQRGAKACTQVSRSWRIMAAIGTSLATPWRYVLCWCNLPLVMTHTGTRKEAAQCKEDKTSLWMITPPKHHCSDSDIQDPGVTCYLRLRTMALTNLVGGYAAGWQRRQRRTQLVFVSAIHHIVVLTKSMPRWSDCLRGRSCETPRTASPRRKEQAVHPPTEQSAGRAWPPPVLAGLVLRNGTTAYRWSSRTGASDFGIS